MAHSIFGWDLPPGCSMQDIERAAGGDYDTLENFAAYCKDKPEYLSAVEKETLGVISNDYSINLSNDNIQMLIYKIIGWAWQQGYDQGRTDEAQYQAYETEKGEKGEKGEK